MNLKRLGTDELIEKCKDVFYDYLVSEEEKFFDGNDFIDCEYDHPTPLDMLFKNQMDCVEECRSRIMMLANEGRTLAEREMTRREVEFLTEEFKHLFQSNMEYQKKLFGESGNLSYTRSAVLIPLDKRINSFYDDLFLEVLFYDNIGVPNGEYSTYRVIETKEVRKNFAKRNTEITHMSLVIPSKVKVSQRLAMIKLVGNINEETFRLRNVTCLNKKFSNFNNLTLYITSHVTNNNDLRQLLQSKVDLDKENLEILSKQVIRGDEYTLLRAKNNILFVRYVCPSTKRVYFNELLLEHLTISPYFNINRVDSFLKAWWNIVHLGAPVEGPNWIRS